MTSTDVPMDNLATMGDNTVPAAGAAGGAEEEEEVLFQVNDDGTVSPEEQKRLRKKIAKKFGEVLLYSIFVLCYTITIIVLSDSKWQFYHNEYMKDLFLEEEFYFEAPEDDPIFIYKKFEDVATNQEFWQWMRGPYLSALGDGDGYIYGTNKLLGVSRIRQMRLAPDTTCELRDRWEPVFPTGCLGEYESSDELETFYPSNANDTGAYGFNIGEPTAVAYPDYFDNVTIAGLSSNFSQRLETAFTFQPEDFYDSDCITAWVQDYCGGGYYADFRGDGEDLAFMQTLEANNWVDVYTRFVVADITTYNANLNLFFFGSALFEFLPTGGILPTSVFRVFRYKRSFGSTFFDFIVVCFVVFYTAQEIFEIVKKKWEYFQDAWNYLDWINLLVFYIVFVVRTLFHITMANKSLDVASTTQFYDLRTAVNLNRVEVSLLAVNAFLLWFKAFKFTEFSLETAIITRTLYRGVRRIAGFVIMIGFIIVGFAQSGVLAFGLDVSDYRSISQSFLSFLRAIQGDFDFGDLYESNRTVSVLYFIAFTILFVFILMNVFLAIVDNAYSDTEDEMRDDPNSVKFNWLKAATGQALQSERIAKQINRAKQLTNVIRREDDLDAIRRGVDRADANEDGVIDRSEADALVARHGPQMENALGVSDTDALFDRFDADGNNVLDADEIAAMNAELDRLRRDAADARQLLQRRGESASNAASTSPPVLAGGGVGGGGGGGMDLVQFTTVNEGIDGLAAELNALDGKIEIILRYFQRTASVSSRRGSNHP